LISKHLGEHFCVLRRHYNSNTLFYSEYLLVLHALVLTEHEHDLPRADGELHGATHLPPAVARLP
jgi:hypothetical protein